MSLGEANSSTDGEPRYVEVVRPFLQVASGEWDLVEDGFWAYATPVGRTGPVQGWKLHVAAVVRNAADVLRTAVPILVEAGCPFKFLSSKGTLHWMTDRAVTPGQAGKFIAAYPPTDHDFATLATALDRALVQQYGPRILTDRPVRRGSIVQYRYGAFRSMTMMTLSGPQPAIRDPDDNLVPDLRLPRFSPPSWVSDPLRPDEAEPLQESAPGLGTLAVTLQNRFQLTKVLLKTSAGGAYQGVDLSNGDAVVAKVARAHIAEDLLGRDARARLHNHLACMTDLRSRNCSVVPEPVSCFDEEDYTVVVERFVAGETLAGQPLWKAGNDHRGLRHRRRLCLALVKAVAEMHTRGWLHRDIKPANVIANGTKVTLLDLELAFARDRLEPPFFAASVGFSSFEQRARAEPEPADDRFSLGCTLFSLCTGLNPYPFYVATDDSWSRWEGLLEYAVNVKLLDLRERTAIAALTAQERSQRPELGEVERTLAGGRLLSLGWRPTDRAAGSRAEASRPSEDQVRAAVSSAVTELGEFIVSQFDGARSDHPWPAAGEANLSVALDVYTGVPGTVIELMQAATVGLVSRQQVDEVIRLATEWVETRYDSAALVPSGLFSGRPGTLWFLAATGHYFADDALLKRVASRFGDLDSSSSNPDVIQGLAGTGIAALGLYRLMPDERLQDTASACGEHLLDLAEPGDSGTSWRVPMDSGGGRGQAFEGYAHGRAGVADFLIALAERFDSDREREVGLRVARDLAERMCSDHSVSSEGADSRIQASWCHGSAGLVPLFLRAHAMTGEGLFIEASNMAGRTVADEIRESDASQCHGVAGFGEALLDLALHAEASTGPALDAAEAILAQLRARGVIGRSGATIREGPTLPWGYSLGLAGILGFFRRLSAGGPRSWSMS